MIDHEALQRAMDALDGGKPEDFWRAFWESGLHPFAVAVVRHKFGRHVWLVPPEDAVDEAVEQLFGTPPGRLRAVVQPRTWFVTIAIRRYVRLLEQRRREVRWDDVPRSQWREPTIEAEQVVADDEPLPPVAYPWPERFVGIVREWLLRGHASSDQRAIISMFLDFQATHRRAPTNAEIAGACGISRDQARRRKFEAFQILRGLADQPRGEANPTA